MELKTLNRTDLPAQALPEKILQFGEGNFLRGFFDWMVQCMNDKAAFQGGVVVVQPRPGGYAHKFNDQDGLYTLYLTGVHDGEPVRTSKVISCIQRGINPYTEFDLLLDFATNMDLRFVVSNTTEAGVYFDSKDTFGEECPVSYPGKLTRVLYERYRFFNGSAERGLVILPFELLEQNGDYVKSLVAKYAVHWNLPPVFMQWVDSACTFCNTLVDRIVPGLYGDERQAAWEELGYRDEIITEGEQFHFLAIETDFPLFRELPFDKAGLNVLLTDDLGPYRRRKVRILNGAHTAMVPMGLLTGLETVMDVFENPTLSRCIETLVFEEVIPCLEGEQGELEVYAQAILDRFRNPFIKHRLLDIALNSTSKFVVRLLPNIHDALSQGRDLPKLTVMALSALLVLYRHAMADTAFTLNDDPNTLAFFREQWTLLTEGKINLPKFVATTLGNTEVWKEDLLSIPDLAEMVTSHVSSILDKGMLMTLEAMFSQQSENS